MTHPVDAHVGKRLRLRRNFLGMSQDTLASASGITFQQVQKYERGVNRMGASRLFEFANILKIPVSFFFEAYEGEETEAYTLPGMAEDTTSPFEYEDKLASKESMEIVRSYHQIKDPVVRKSVLELVKSLADGQ